MIKEIKSWLQKIARAEIWNMAPYSSARSEISDMTGLLQLNANENPYLPYPQGLQNIKLNNHDSLNRYPDSQPQALLNRLAAIYQVKADQVLVGRGMDEIIDLLIRVFCIPYQDNILITPPTFAYYKFAAEISAAQVISVPLDEKQQFAVDITQLINSCNNNTKIVFLCTPNNPTANLVNLEEIEQIAIALPNTIIAIDEAYIEFADVVSATTLLHKFCNLVVMRTLSKAYAFAGVRIGTLIAAPEIINLVAKVLAPYPLPVPCVSLALDTLSPFGLELAYSRITLLKAERERMYKLLQQVSNVYVYPSKANFLLIKTDDALQLYNILLAKGILVRNRSSYVPNTLRISIGSPDENNCVLEAFGLSNFINFAVD